MGAVPQKLCPQLELHQVEPESVQADLVFIRGASIPTVDRELVFYDWGFGDMLAVEYFPDSIE